MDTQCYKGYHIEVSVKVDYWYTLTVTCRELSGKLPNKIYTDKPSAGITSGYTIGSWRHLLPAYHGRAAALVQVGNAIFEMFKEQHYLELYVGDTAPKPIIRKPVDRERISRGGKDRVFQFLKEIKNARETI
jgi:hypothetical protein